MLSAAATRVLVQSLPCISGRLTVRQSSLQGCLAQAVHLMTVLCWAALHKQILLHISAAWRDSRQSVDLQMDAAGRLGQDSHALSGEG